MLDNTWKGLNFILAFLLISISSLTANAQFNSESKVRKIKYLHLSKGLTHDEELPFIPQGPQYEGDWRKCVGLALDNNTRKLRFAPKEVGTCSLIIRDRAGRRVFEFSLIVKKSTLNNIAREIRSLLSDIDGIHIKIINNKVVIDGQILLPREMNRIFSVCSEYGANCSSLVTMSPLAQKKLSRIIEKEINNPQIFVKAVNDRFILEGVAKDENEKQRAEIIAKTYVPDVVIEKGVAGGVIKKRKKEQIIINLLTVKDAPPPEPGKIIQLVIHYVELKKDYAKNFSFQWTPTLGDNTNVSFQAGSRESAGIISQISGTINNLLPKLNRAKSHGYARVLKSSTMIVQDGNKGVFKAQTQLPYQVMSKDGIASTQFTEAGLSTDIMPKIMGGKSDTIQLNINFNINELLNISEAGPIISKNVINTVIMVRSGQSAAIGGLVSSGQSKDFNKLPPGVANPLFTLYASKSFRKDQSQFVVFITPIIKSSASEGTDRVKRKFRLLN